ncbi:MAG: hypothetical protein Q7T40_12275 [Methylobacter sp.]|nr:hypothetical protein [Methylobacter sp.]
MRHYGCISRPNRWERIETADGVDITAAINVSPGLTAGSGLKQSIDRQR